jgi:DNA-directed RNA polymerase subunit M/transcription elongation factor TFIIS
MLSFCDLCGNLLHHKLKDEKIMYSCDICGNSQDLTSNSIYSFKFTESDNDYLLNNNMIYDSCLPRTKKIQCPTCEDFNELILFQYNPRILNIGYMCTVCLNYWKN